MFPWDNNVGRRNVKRTKYVRRNRKQSRSVKDVGVTCFKNVEDNNIQKPPAKTEQSKWVKEKEREK